MVLVQKNERKAVYQYLLREGTIVVKKDTALAKHQDLPVPNLKVMMICKSLVSKGLLEERFNWQWLYYNLTSDGIKSMCEYLGLPTNIKPDIYKKPATQRRAPEEERPAGQRPRGFGRGQVRQQA